MKVNERDELIQIIQKFAGSGWDLIDAPSKSWLNGSGDRDKLIAAIEEADKVCGSCGCEFDPLYKRALELKTFI
jgi:hypothetical protein